MQMSVFFLCTYVIRPVAYGLFSVFVTSPFGERLAKATEITKKNKKTIIIIHSS